MELKINRPLKGTVLHQLAIGTYFTFADKNTNVVLRVVNPLEEGGVTTVLIAEEGTRFAGRIVTYEGLRSTRPVTPLRVVSMEFEEIV